MKNQHGENWRLFVFEVTRTPERGGLPSGGLCRRVCVCAPGREAALLGVGLHKDEQCSEVRPRPWDLLRGRFRPGLREYADFFEVLGASLGAGSPVLHALRLASRQATSAGMRGLAGALALSVSRGDELHEAMARLPSRFSGAQVALARAAAQGGLMHAGPLYLRLARSLSRDARLAGKLQAALAYPILLLCMAGAASLILEFKALPPMVELFRSMGAQLPLFTRIFYTASQLFAENLTLVLPFGLLVSCSVPLLGRRLLANPRVQGLLLEIPGLGPVLRARALARALGSFCLLNRCGCVNRELFEHASASSGNAAVSAFFDAANRRVAAGLPLEEAFSQERHRLGDTGVRLAGKMELGLDSGDLNELLEEFVSEIEDEADTRAAMLPRLMEIPMLLLCALVVGSIMLAMFLPYPSLLGDIAQQLHP